MGVQEALRFLPKSQFHACDQTEPAPSADISEESKRAILWESATKPLKIGEKSGTRHQYPSSELTCDVSFTPIR